MTKKTESSTLTKIFVPVASAFIIFIGGICYHYVMNINVLPSRVERLERKIDSLNQVYNNWIAHLDEEMAEQQKLTGK